MAAALLRARGLNVLLIVQAGQNDGSCFTRPMTDAELDEQSRQIAAM